MGVITTTVSVKMPMTTFVAAALLAFCSTGDLQAASIDYALGSTNSSAASIWSTGGALSKVEGINIDVRDVLGRDTPAHAGELLPFSDALFAFSSGTFSSSVGSLYTYGPHGSFNVVGSFDFNQNGSIEAAEQNRTLLSGTIGTLTLDRSNSSTYQIKNAVLNVTDYALASYFGYPVGTFFNGIMNLSFNVTDVPDEFQGGSTTNGGITTSPVPVPAAAMLMFSGLAGLVGLRRRISSPAG